MLIATMTPLIGWRGRFLPQHLEEGEPALAIDFGVRILGRIAPGGVDQHGGVSKPPVAIAGASDALDGLGRVVAGERKLEARN